VFVQIPDTALLTALISQGEMIALIER